MACYNPLQYVTRGINKKTWKQEIVIVKTKTAKVNNVLKTSTGTLPCGKCIGCRLDKSREWANRCVLESKQWKNNYFITLTYNDEHLPVNEKIIKNHTTGEITNSKPSLQKRDLKLFLKKLRRHYEYHHDHKDIRYFACGEYGEKYERPHYHAIIFNLPIMDLKIHKENFEGDPLYTSETISKIWGKGYVIIGNTNWNTAAYVARYIMKKQVDKNEDFYEKYGIEKEYVTMSRNPGIGAGYYNKNKEKIYKHDYININTKNGVVKAKPPGYFDRLYHEIEPKKLYNLKLKRQQIITNKQNNLLKQYPNSNIYEIQYDEFIAKAKQELYLKRKRKGVK